MGTARDAGIVSVFVIAMILVCYVCYSLTGVAGVVLLLLCLKDSLLNTTTSKRKSFLPSSRDKDLVSFSGDQCSVSSAKGQSSLPHTKELGAQDAFEIEVLRRGSVEVESLEKWRKCTKNPNHIGFIPAPKFEIDDLPSYYQTQDWFFFIRNFAHLCVRLRVNGVSPNRPKAGPFSLALGDEIHAGTGYIGGFKAQDSLCPCRDCEGRDVSKRSMKWWRLMITTTASVVFDEDEVRATSVDIYYDDEDAEREGRMKTVHGYEIKGSSSRIDACVFHAAFHDDEESAELVRQTRKNAVQGWLRIREKILETKGFHPPTKAVLVSHPHAGPKMITVGDITKLSPVTLGEEESEYTWQMFECEYTTPSCAGSSGGNILWLGDLRLGDIGFGWWVGTHCKSGGKDGSNHGARLCIKRNSSVFWKKPKKASGYFVDKCTVL